MEPFYNLPFIKIVKNKKDYKFKTDKNVLIFKREQQAYSNDWVLFVDILNLKKYIYTNNLLRNIKNNYNDIELFCTENKILLIVTNSSQNGLDQLYSVIGLKFLCNKQRLLFQLKYAEHLIKIV
jgi:hypothetical protein